MPFARTTSLLGANAVVSLPAYPGVTHYIDAVSVSYTAAGLGNLKVEDMDGKGVLYDADVLGAGSPITIPHQFNGSMSTELRVTLSGIQLLVGKVTVEYHDHVHG